MKGIGFATDNNFEIKVGNREILISNTTDQNQAVLLTMELGSLKDNEKIGVGISNYINSEDSTLLQKNIIEQFNKEELKIKKLNISGDNIEIEASY